jgi:hypothetical protein
MPLSVWVEFSKQSSKYKDGECESKWKTFKDKKLSIGSLYWYARQCDPKRYYELRLKDANEAIFEKPIVDTIEINQRYLLDKINDSQYEICSVMRKHLDDLFYSDNKVLNIKSPYGTSKTQLMIKMIEQYNPKSILMLSYRQTLTLDFKKNFQQLGFQDYLTGDLESDRLIIQVESLLKLDTSEILRQYDLVLIDESERILNQFSSHETFNHKEKDSFDYLYHIIRGSKKVICMDGGQGNRTYSFMKHFGKNISLVNKSQVHNHEIALMDDIDKWTNDIISDLSNNQKVVIASMSATDLKTLYDKLIGLYPEKKIKMYTRNTDSKVKMTDASDVTNAWSELDCLMYSPCFEAGVNFDVKHFDKLYGLLTSGSCSQESFYQMIARVRHFTCNVYKVFKGDLPEYEYADFWTYEEVKAGLIENNNEILKPTYKDVDGHIERVYELDPYNINCIYNKMETLNKNKQYFLTYFNKLGKSKGYKIYNISDDFIDETDDKKPVEEEKVSKFESVLKAEDIDDGKFRDLLQKQIANQTSETDKIKIEKYMYKKNLGVDELNEDIMNCYYRKTNTIKNYIYLLDDKAIFQGNTQHIDEQNSKLTIIRNLIKLLGWKHVNDKTVFDNNTFEENMIETICKSKAFTDQKTKVIFNLQKSTINLKGDYSTVRYLNELLKTFGLKIDVSYHGKKRIAQNRQYALSEINNISEIAHYLITRGKIKLPAENHFVKPDQMRFESLFKYQKPEIETVDYGDFLDEGIWEDDL